MGRTPVRLCVHRRPRQECTRFVTTMPLGLGPGRFDVACAPPRCSDLRCVRPRSATQHSANEHPIREGLPGSIVGAETPRGTSRLAAVRTEDRRVSRRACRFGDVTIARSADGPWRLFGCHALVPGASPLTPLSPPRAPRSSASSGMSEGRGRRDRFRRCRREANAPSAIRGAFHRRVAPTPHALFRHRSLGPSPARAALAHRTHEPSAPFRPPASPVTLAASRGLLVRAHAPFGDVPVRISSVGLGSRSRSSPPRCCRGTCGPPPSGTVAACRLLQTASTYGHVLEGRVPRPHRSRGPRGPTRSPAFPRVRLAPSRARASPRDPAADVHRRAVHPVFVALRRRGRPWNLAGSTGRVKDADREIAFPSSWSCRALLVARPVPRKPWSSSAAPQARAPSRDVDVRGLHAVRAEGHPRDAAPRRETPLRRPEGLSP